MKGRRTPVAECFYDEEGSSARDIVRASFMLFVKSLLPDAAG